MAPQQMRDGDWMCPECNNHNFASRQTCNKCGAPKVEGGVVYGSAPARPRPAPRPSPYAAPQMVAVVPYAPPPRRQMMPPSVASSGGAAPPANMKDGDWMCPECGNHNFASRVNCNKCGALREGMRQGDWICRECKNHNFANRTTCNKCNAPRHDAPPSGARRAHSAPPAGGCYGGKGGMMYGGGGYDPYMMMAAPAYPVYGQKGMGFQPYASPAVVPYYGMKGAPMAMAMAPPMANGKPMKDGDWMCPNCGNHNFASRVKCNKCATIRQGFKDGDWICKNCKNHNFASRTECNKCAHPREPGQ